MSVVRAYKVKGSFSSGGYRVKISKPKHDAVSRSFSHSVSKAIKAHQDKGLPVARYDTVGKKAYLEYPNGNRKYIEIP